MTDLIVDVDDGVAVLTLNRPERRNAYTEQMGALLNAAYRDCDGADDVRVIVLTGAGENFCVGADLAAPTNPFATSGPAFTASPIDPAAFELRTPVIAAVNGHAIGIGLTIALQADIRLLAAEATFAVAQSRRGVIGDCMSHWTLPHLAGVAVAADLLLTGRAFDGVEAARMGIATRALPSTDVLDEALVIARDIATKRRAHVGSAQQAVALGHSDQELRSARGSGSGDRVASACDGQRRRKGGCRGISGTTCAAVEFVGLTRVATVARSAEIAGRWFLATVAARPEGRAARETKGRGRCRTRRPGCSRWRRRVLPLRKVRRGWRLPRRRVRRHRRVRRG